MRVLVVEDDLPMAAAIRRALRGVDVIGDVAGTSGAACASLATADGEKPQNPRRISTLAAGDDSFRTLA